MATITHFGIEVEDVSNFIENLPNIYSQAYQDIFAFGMNNFKKDGTFVDIGCAMPRDCNNTYFLELMGWTGLSFDIKDFSNLWNKHRKDKFIHCNCETFNFKELFDQTFTSNTIDYLSFDVDQASNAVLPKLPFDSYKFNVITIEHDMFTGTSEYKQFQHTFLKEKNYYCLAENICVNNVTHTRLPFEDWWITNDIYCKYKHLLDKQKLLNGYAWEVLSYLNIDYNRENFINRKN